MHVVALVVLVALLAACGGDGRSDVADQRAGQARQAALDAGLDQEVADFLALAARGRHTTHRVTYPGPSEGTKLAVTSRPPDRRVDLLVDGEVTETRLVLDGSAYTCRPAEGCERTDAAVDPPGAFTEEALDELRAALAGRTEDFAFSLETLPVAGVEARCLVTRVRSGRERPELGSSGTICLAPSGAVLLVDRGGERIEALDHSADVDDDLFELPDEVPDGTTDRGHGG